MFNFAGTNQPQVSQPTTGFGFGQTSSAPAYGTGLGTQGFGFAQPTSTSNLVLPSYGLANTLQQQQPQQQQFQTTQPLIQLTTATTSTTTSIVNRGLGGEGASGESSSSNNKSPKDQPIPAEIKAVVDTFKNFLKDQKSIRDENAQEKYSLQPIINISNELDDGIRIQLERLDVVLQKNGKTVENLKKDTSNLYEDGDNAVRGLKHDSMSSTSSDYGSFLGQNRFISSPATHSYFVKLVREFEDTMDSYSKQIRELEVHLDNMNKPVNAQELILVVRKQHDSLVSLAAEIYGMHEQIAKLTNDPRVTSYSSGVEPSRPPTTVQHKTISLNRESEKKTLSEKQVTNPIAFPTFSFDSTKNQPTQETSSFGSGVALSQERGMGGISFMPTGDVMSPLSGFGQKGMSTFTQSPLSPSQGMGGNMSFGSPQLGTSSSPSSPSHTFNAFSPNKSVRF